jgi:FkbM family methyltransferase
VSNSVTARPGLLKRGFPWVCGLAAVGTGYWCSVLSERLSETRVELRRAERDVESLSVLADPHAVARLRDRNFEFVIRNYGFEYQGRTGELIDDSILMCGLWEKEVAFFMRDCLLRLPGDRKVFVDIGCNAGQHSLLLAQNVDEVHAFDPYPPAIERFQRLIEQNHFQNIEVYQLGLGNEEGTRPYFAPVADDARTGTFSEFLGRQGEREVIRDCPVVRGDDWFAAHGITDIALIRIDAEGFEAAVLEGLRDTLETQAPVVTFEVTTPPGGTIDSLATLQALFPENYRLLVFRVARDASVTGDYRLEDFDRHADDFFEDAVQGMLVAAPADKLGFVPREREVGESTADDGMTADQRP